MIGVVDVGTGKEWIKKGTPIEIIYIDGEVVAKQKGAFFVNAAILTDQDCFFDNEWSFCDTARREEAIRFKNEIWIVKYRKDGMPAFAAYLSNDSIIRPK